MRKIILAFLLMASLALTSCDGLFGDENPSTGEEVEFEQIVVADSDMDIIKVRSKIISLLGTMGTVEPTEDAREGEIVFGDTSRPITSAAKAELDKLLAESAADAGYVIYYDGKSVATYWSAEQLCELALSRFMSICIDEMSLELEVGVIDSGAFSTAQLDRDARWLAIEAAASPKIYNALKAWNLYFNGPVTCEWLANLYDGERGGFYYSASARDNYPFLPDLESTYQTLSWLTGNGAINNINLEFPEELKAKILGFVKGTQSEDDGYFYHEQWGSRDQLNVDRYGRDLTWGTSLIKQLKLDTDGDGVYEDQYPLYCAPSGLKCERHANTNDTCFSTAVSVASTVSGGNSAITSALKSSVSTAVSRLNSSTVRAVASGPDYSSSQAFINWLKEYSPVESVKENSGNAHNINALQDEIISRGYADELVGYLVDIQKKVYEEQPEGERSGLWQYEPNYRFVWGIHKYVPFYNNVKQSLMYHKEIVASCIEVVLSPANKSYAMNDLMNQWTAIRAVIGNAKSHNPDVVPELYAMVEENFVDMVNTTISKLDDFKLPNGTFGYTVGGHSLSSIYAVPISLGLREADVNGQLLVGSCYRAIFETLDFSPIPLCTTDDGKKFVETVMTLEPAPKNPVEAAETYDYEDGSAEDYVAEGKITTVVRTNECELDIVYDSESRSNVLSFLSGIGTAGYGDYLRLTASGIGGNCNIAEFDFYINSTSKNADLYQVKVGNGYMFVINSNGTHLKFKVISDESSSARTETIVGEDKGIRVDEWHRIRIEIYKPDEGETVPVVKFFVDGVCYYERAFTYYGQNKGNNYGHAFKNLQFYSMMSVRNEMYIDNVYLSQEMKTFTEGDDISDARNN